MNKLTLSAYILILAMGFFQPVVAEDWPTYQHDNRRSGVTAETLPEGLAEAWVYRSPSQPKTSWTPPAKWDAFSGNSGLQPMRNFDSAFFVTVKGDDVFFGSSVDHAAHCLDAKTGKEKWVYFTDGAVRLPPTWHEGKVYFGSDDGFVYCVNAADGQLLWKYKAAEKERMIPSNGKMISLWPCRTGVLVQNGQAYFGASLVPWNHSYLCSVNLDSGSPTYKNKLEGVTLQGALLSTADILYMPQGRSAPMRFDMATGKGKGSVGGSGGVFSILTPDEQFISGPNNQKPSQSEIRFFGGPKDKMVLSFQGMNRIVVAGERAFIHQKNELASIDRIKYAELFKTKTKDKSSCYQWRTPHDQPFGYIVAGRHLWVGSEGAVDRFEVDSGKSNWRASFKGRAHGLAAANGRLFVSTDRGSIHCFSLVAGSK